MMRREASLLLTRRETADHVGWHGCHYRHGEKSITLTNEAESVIVMDDKSIGLQADTIALEGRKSVTLLSGNECMVLSSERV